ncbi:Gfo/Idh/MocA family oxidoreductase [Rhodoferax sp.]|uniref:Gfo/Idh/MocA family protein n=1 Tax=Rhodoferax sp. TaxID=50421 RepID=UPI0025DE3CB4|nr:Gfo/Idh/MocA family oxidoreductase [Rhodoferax sp.]
MQRRIRIGLVGGGQGSFIAAAHRAAARLDDGYELVAGALSSDPQRALASGLELRLDPERCYADYADMARREAQRPDGIDAVVIVTPNHLHFPVAQAFLEQGIHVICDKPMTTRLDHADVLLELAERQGLLFMVTHTYSGYPMARHARELVRNGALGDIRVVQVEYAQDWLAEPLELTGQKQAEWRADPKRAGPAGALGDIGTHAFHLAGFVTGLQVDQLAAELTTFVPGRALDDHVQVMLRYQGGARGMLWASQVATGSANRLQLRVFGSRAAIHFDQESPDQLLFTGLGEATQIVRRGATPAGGDAALATRLPAGHPEGYFEAFAQLYRDFSLAWQARVAGLPFDTAHHPMPTVRDGRQGMAFIDAVLRSHQGGSSWVTLS